jgi:hypothetical protein
MIPDITISEVPVPEDRPKRTRRAFSSRLQLMNIVLLLCDYATRARSHSEPEYVSNASFWPGACQNCTRESHVMVEAGKSTFLHAPSHLY